MFLDELEEKKQNTDADSFNISPAKPGTTG
jgi:hypothetical protein